MTPCAIISSIICLVAVLIVTAGGLFLFFWEFKDMAGGNWKDAKSVYDFDYIDIDGNPQSMKRFE